MNNQAIVTYVAPMHFENDALIMFIGCLKAQYSKNWKAIIFHNSPNPEAEAIVKYFSDSRITYKESEVDSGAWGTYNRIFALNNMVDTPYTVFTSIQDYWFPKTTGFIEQVQGKDIICWDSLNHLHSDSIMNCNLQSHACDWGNLAFRTELGRKVGINKPDLFQADGHFVQDLLKTKPTIIKLPLCLTAHN